MTTAAEHFTADDAASGNSEMTDLGLLYLALTNERAFQQAVLAPGKKVTFTVGS